MDARTCTTPPHNIILDLKLRRTSCGRRHSSDSGGGGGGKGSFSGFYIIGCARRKRGIYEFLYVRITQQLFVKYLYSYDAFIQIYVYDSYESYGAILSRNLLLYLSTCVLRVEIDISMFYSFLIG